MLQFITVSALRNNFWDRSGLSSCGLVPRYVTGASSMHIGCSSSVGKCVRKGRVITCSVQDGSNVLAAGHQSNSLGGCGYV